MTGSLLWESEAADGQDLRWCILQNSKVTCMKSLQPKSRMRVQVCMWSINADATNLLLFSQRALRQTRENAKTPESTPFQREVPLNERSSLLRDCSDLLNLLEAPMHSVLTCRLSAPR